MGSSKYKGKFKSGQRIGVWEVTTGDIVFKGKHGHKTAHVECRCTSCGSHLLVACHHLGKRSFKCSNCDSRYKKTNLNPHWKGEGPVSKTLLTKISQSHGKDAVGFDLNLEDLYDQYINQTSVTTMGNAKILPNSNTFNTPTSILTTNTITTCALTNSPIDVNLSTVAKVDPNRGYTRGNIAFVDRRFEGLTKKYSINEIVDLCTDVAEKYKKIKKGKK